jgi:hypothetical protein
MRKFVFGLVVAGATLAGAIAPCLTADAIDLSNNPSPTITGGTINTGGTMINGGSKNSTPKSVPWETDALSVIGSTILFAGGLWARNKFAKPLQK